jgi:hypothetical protein
MFRTARGALRWPQYFDRRIRYCGNHGLLSFRIHSREPCTDRLRTPAHRLYGDQIGPSSGSREVLVRGERLPTTGLPARHASFRDRASSYSCLPGLPRRVRTALDEYNAAFEALTEAVMQALKEIGERIINSKPHPVSWAVV